MSSRMNIIDCQSTDPFFNLALEEVLLKESRGEFILIYCNSPSVVIGKHQSAHRETDTRYVTEHDIPVIRRISGGGTVYHDEGNINFTFIRNSEEGRQIDFPKYTGPVLAFLASLGLVPVLSGSDILIEGRKVSGNAEHVHRTRVLHHGTLLFSADLDKLRGSIRKDYSAYTTRAVSSNPSPVANLNGFLANFTSAGAFRKALTEYLAFEFSASEYVPSGKEMSAAEELAAKKYRTWEWNYSYGPEYRLSGQIINGGQPSGFILEVHDGLIREFSCGFLKDDLAGKFRGLRHMPYEMKDVFSKAGFHDMGIFEFF